MDNTDAIRAGMRLKELFPVGYNFEIDHMDGEWTVEIVKLIGHQEAILENLAIMFRRFDTEEFQEGMSAERKCEILMMMIEDATL